MIFSKTLKLLIVITVLAILMQTVSAYTSVTYQKDGTYVHYTNTKAGDYSCFYGGCATSTGVYDNVIIGKEKPHSYYYQSGTSYYYPSETYNYYPSKPSNYYPYGTTHYTNPTYYGYYYPSVTYNYNYYYTPYTWRYGYYPYP